MSLFRRTRNQRKKAKPPIVVRPSPLGPTRAVVQLGLLVFPAAIGRGGISAMKREGDGATPRARMRVTSGFYRGDRLARPRTALNLVAIGAAMGWCDDPTHAAYNRRVKLPFAASHEALRREDHLYDLCLVLDWNRSCRRRNRGSAIFFHVAKPGYAPTEGCIAVSRPALTRIVGLVGQHTTVIVR